MKDYDPRELEGLPSDHESKVVWPAIRLGLIVSVIIIGAFIAVALIGAVS